MRKAAPFVLAVWCLLAGSATAQEPESQPTPPESVQAAVERLDELVREAEALLKKGDQAGALAVCQRALAAARLEGASDAWLAAVADALWRLGSAAYRSSDLRSAHDAWQAVHRHRSATLPDDHPDLQAARQNVAVTRKALGDLPGALVLQEKVLAVQSARLPDNHPDLQRARGNLAGTKYALGDLRGALALQEKVFAVLSSTLPDDHPDLQLARQNLAVTKQTLGDLPGALALMEKVLAVRSATLPDDHPDLQAARLNLAATKAELGDVPGALALEEKVLAVQSATLPDDHPDLQLARQNLAVTKQTLGDLPGALALMEKVLAVQSATLPDDHPDLQRTRNNLAVTKLELGDPPGALALQERVLVVLSASLPHDHPDLQLARQNLAVTKQTLGDLPGAVALMEKVLAVLSANLPDEHPDLQAARMNLAAPKRELGDLPGALALQEKVFAVWSSTLPDDHPDMHWARGALANTKAKLGDLPGALALQEKVFTVRSARLPDDHPDLQAARHDLATTKFELGDLPGALALEEKVFAVQLARLPDDHPDLQRARGNLAVTKAKLGDLPGALALQEMVLAVRSSTLSDDHPDLQAARHNVAFTKMVLGNLRAAAQMNRSAVAGALARLLTSLVSTREVAQLAIAAAEPLSLSGSLLDASAATSSDSALPAELGAALARDSLSLLTTIRSAEGHTAELFRAVRARDPEPFERHRRAISVASKQVEDAIALPPAGRTDGSGRQVSRDDAIREAVLQKDAAERALAALVPEELRAVPTAERLAAGLAPSEAAVTFLTYTRWTNDPEKPWVTTSEKRFAAFVLTPAGHVTWHSLASTEIVDTLIAAIRSDALAGQQLAVRADAERADANPGRDPDEPVAKPDSLTPRLVELRALLFDPILAALPEGTKTIVLSPADEMLLLPFEHLPLANGKALGETYDLRTVPSLRSLLRPPPARPADPGALVVGGIDYDTAPDDAAPVVPEAATPILEATPAAPDASRDSDGAKHFAPLPGTKAEAEKIVATFVASFPERTPTALSTSMASEALLVDEAPGKTFLHLATHGYFAPESAWQATDARDQGALARFDVGREDRTAQLSPFSLCGVALAGANLPPDELGRREGILTAQEIAQLDLTSCYLATLSACNTSLGVRRGGTGLASLRQAFHAAGARFVLATLWEVNDTQAEQLMADFYTRLWKHGDDPHTALRAAQRAARERGAPFRDWAGWMISGR